MKTSIHLSYLLLLFAPIITFGQSTFQDNLFKKSFEFSFHVLNAQPLTISKNYPTQENDLTPNNSFSFQANLIRHARLNSKLSIQTGIIVGVSSSKFTLNLTEDFRQLGWDGYNDYFTEYEFPYIGLNIGLNYFIFSNEKNLISGGLSVCGIGNLAPGYGFGVSASGTSGMPKELLTARFGVKDDGQILILPQLEIGYHRMISPRLSFKGAFVGAFSNKNYLNGSYIIFGDNEILTGKLGKKFNQFGISFGIVFALKK